MGLCRDHDLLAQADALPPVIFDAMFLAAQVARGSLDQTVTAWLSTAFAAWIRAGGDVPLERCLHLPAGQKKRQIVRRNAWIRVAALCIEGSGVHYISLALEREMARFLTRGGWERWKGQALPPRTCSDLDAALFFVAKANGGKGLSARQLRRVLGHFFTSQCPAELQSMGAYRSGATPQPSCSKGTP